MPRLRSFVSRSSFPLGPLVLLMALACSWPAHAADAAGKQVQAAVTQLREDILPPLGAELSALHADSAAAIEDVGAGQTVIAMRRALVAMDEDLGAIARALQAEALDVPALLTTIDRFGATAVDFGRDMERLVGKEPRFEPLRVENEPARKRLLRLASQYTRLADAVSELLGLLPDAVDARYRQLDTPR